LDGLWAFAPRRGGEVLARYLLKLPKEAGEVSQLFEILISDAVRIEVHNVIPYHAHTI
jgi:hypothetical protein